MIFSKPLQGRILNFVFFLYLFSFGVEEIFSLKIFGNNVFFPELIFVFLFLLFVFIFRHDVFKISINQIDIAAFLYWFSVMASFVVNRGKNSFGEFLACSYMLLLYFITKSIFVNRMVKKETLIPFLIFSSLVTGLISIVGVYIVDIDSFYQFHKNYYLLGDLVRVDGLFRGPIYFGNYIAVVLLLVMGYYVNMRKITLPLIVYFSFLLLIFVSTFNKTIFPLISSIILLFILNIRYYNVNISKKVNLGLKTIATFLTLIYVFLSHFFIYDNQNIVGKLLASKEHSSCISYPVLDGNLILIPLPYTLTKLSAIEAFKENIFFGIGGNELINFNHILFRQGRVFNCDINMASHSTYFGALAELGLFGFFALSIIIYFIYKNLVKLKEYNLSIYTVSIPIFVYLLLEAITMDLMNVRYIWIFLGFLSSQMYFIKLQKNIRNIQKLCLI